MQIYCIINSVSAYIFRPPMVAIFKEGFFEGRITWNVKRIKNMKCCVSNKSLKSTLEYKLLIKPSKINFVDILYIF